MSLAALAILLGCGAASAQQINVKIGVLTDMSSLYADATGPGSVAAAKMAIADFTKTSSQREGRAAQRRSSEQAGRRFAASPTSGTTSTRSTSIVDVPNSGVALAVSQITSQKNKVFVVSGAASSDLTGPKCNANTVHWTYDTWMLANGTGKAMVKTGGDTWFFLTADYAFGYALERDTAAVVEKNGGKVLGKVRHPLNTNDFSSFLLQAQTSKAKVIGLANAGGDTINSIKQASEFGIVKGGQSLAGLLVFATDINALGLQTAQGLVADRDLVLGLERRQPRLDQALAQERGVTNKYPAMNHAGVYAGITHYLKAVAALTERGRRQGGGGADEENADRRSAVRQGQRPRRRPRHPPGLSVRGEEAVGIEVSRRLLQDPRHHPGG